jgi:TolB-like protein
MRRRLPMRWKIFSGAVAALLAGSLWLRFTAPPVPAAAAVPASPRSLAVRPFRNVGPDTTVDALGAALAGELVDVLSRVPGLRVADPVSLRVAARGTADPRALGRRLGVGSVLEGDIRITGDRLRITTHLVSVERGFDLWSETFDQRAAELLVARDSIARSVVSTLRLPTQRRPTPVTGDSAYRAYLRGRAAMIRTGRDPERAIAAFSDAVRLDSSYAPAWAGLAEAYTAELLADTRPPAGPAEAARAAAERALALDGRAARALLARGIVRLTYDRAWAQAGDDFRRAAALDPGDPEPAHWRSHLFLAQRLVDSSLAASVEAISRSPLDPARRLHLAWNYAMAGADTLAASTFAGVVLDSTLLATDQHLPLLLEIAGDSAGALEGLTRALAAAPGRLDLVAELARLHALAERPDTARALLTRLQAPADSGWVSPYALALVHAALGQRRAAFAALGRALEERDPAVVALMLDPRLAGLRRDRRFAGLVRRLAAD